MNFKTGHIFKIITWPEIQEYMDYNDFEENACLANDEAWIEMLGPSAYFVDIDWLSQIKNDK